jgi:hypothetical protein
MIQRIDGLPIKDGGSFHDYVSHNQRVPTTAMRDMSAPRSFGSAGSGLVRVVFPSTGRAPEREEEAAAWAPVVVADLLEMAVGHCKTAWVTKPLSH